MLPIKHVPTCRGNYTFDGGVHVWTLCEGEKLFDWIQTTDVLSEREEQRRDNIGHAGVREQFELGRILVRNVLSRLLKCRPKDVPIDIAAYGKPIVEGNPLYFNQSHTEGVIVLAVADSPVGIDIECQFVDRDIHGLVGRFFTTGECQQFQSLPEELHEASFLRGWTCKEAVLKGVGTGVRDLQNCEVDMDPRLPPSVVQSPDGQPWQLATWELPGYTFAVACSGRSEESLPVENEQ